MSEGWTLDNEAIFLTLYVPCIMFQCVDKPTRCITSYERSLLSINWLYMFRTITSPSSGASSHKLYNALVCSCYQASLAAAWMYIHKAARLARTNIPLRYTVKLLRECTSTQQLDSPARTYQCVIQFLRWCSWWWTGDSPKHAEPING